MHITSYRRAFIVATLAAAGGAASLEAGTLPPLRLESHASGFSLPVAFVQDPSNPSVQYVVQQRGRIRVLVNGVVQGNDLLDLTGTVSTSGDEQGLLGLAFPPDYATDGRFYVNYTNNQAGNDPTHIVRYTRDPNDPLRALEGSAELLLQIAQPFSNHNGGNMAFGSDGYLYIGMGDGGGSGDSAHRAQNPDLLLGKMLRIDVSPETGYDVPADNPFIDGDPVDALPEIWAFGLRNPWRWSFDDPMLGGTGALIIGDVGQNAWEEIDYEPALAGGRNYGWRNREGAHDFNQSIDPAYLPLIDPIHEYSHGQGLAVTGGFVYRGTALGPEFYGRYFFADFSFSRIWSMQLTIDGNGEATASDVVNHTAELGGSNVLGNPSSFGIDADGEIYFCAFNGQVRRLGLQTVTVPPDSFTRIRGLGVSGGLSELFNSDNNRLVTRPDMLVVTTTPPVQIEVVGTSPETNPADLTFRVESHVSVNNILQRVRMFNYETAAYELVDSRVMPTSDVVIDLLPADVADAYVQDGTGQVKSLIQCVQVAFNIVPTWQSRIDQTVWVVTP